ncbi:MAG: alkaline phosphatase D family protein, partial [Microthrixaceae bacterium]|nr:alkaline phosphatase D family protein [Microthrixaceae bacterium]
MTAMYTGEIMSATPTAPRRTAHHLRAGATTRRTFLGGTALIGAGALAACGGDDAGSPAAEASTTLPPVPELSGDPFALGVASGDPDATSVILWTRVVVDPNEPDGGVGDEPVPVTWEVATDEAFGAVIASGTEVATAEFAHAVHATADRLEPDGTYWYRFRIGEAVSPVGRTRTMPAEGEQPSSGRFRFAMATCQDFQAGRYAAWGDAAALEDLDAIVFLGDYVYELPNLFTGPDGDTSRQYTSDVPTDLAGFRARYSQVKGDEQLQAAHATAPFFATWDDHEVVNNYTKNVDPELRQAAYQAWWEHLPVRLPAPRNGELAVYRTLDVGALIQLFILDTRQYTDEPPCPGDDGLGTVADCDARTGEERTLLGEAQKTWL